MREIIRSEIAALDPLDELEATQIADTLAWIESGSEIFRITKPATPPRHLVSYFLLVDGDHLLLVDHIKAKLWLPTGGHVDPGEHPKETVRREVVEELGIEAEFLSEAPIFLSVAETVGLTAGHTDVSLWYALKGERGMPLDFDGSEFHSVKWFHKEDVPFERSDPHLKRFLAKLA